MADRQIETTGQLDATDKLAITRYGFYDSSAVVLPAGVETETASVTVLLLKTTDTLLIQGRQYLTNTAVISAPASLTGRLRVGDVAGLLLDGAAPPPFSASPGTGKADATYAKRGIVEQQLRYSPQAVGEYTIVMTAISGNTGSARDRSLTVQVKRLVNRDGKDEDMGAPSVPNLSDQVVPNAKLAQLVAAALVDLGPGYVAETIRTGAQPSEEWRWKTAALVASRTLTAAEDVPLDRNAVATILSMLFSGVLLQCTGEALQLQALAGAYAAQLKAKDELIAGLELEIELHGRRCNP